MSLLARRRAMMGAHGGSGGVFDWTPKDGVTPFAITASSGATPVYSLTEQGLKLYAPAGWQSLRLSVNNFVYGNAYKITMEYADLYGDNINVYLTSRQDNGLNNRITLSVLNKKYDIIGLNTVVIPANPFPRSGIVELIVNKNTGKISAILNGATHGPYDMSDSLTTSHHLLYVEGNNATRYIEITHLRIENL